LALPAAVEVAGYRIAMKAMTNTARHARARHCRLRLSPLHDGLQIEITDDGVGLPSACREGIGLGAMRERAAELGGSCVIDGRDGGGTCLVAQLPLVRG